MTHLLDAHALIWSQDDPVRLGAAPVTVMSDPANVLAVSIATIWEIGIKTAIGKLRLSKPFRDWLDTAVSDLGLVIMGMTVDHVERQAGLPLHHRDPFDRILAAQSLVASLPLVSSDSIFDTYSVNRVWD